MHQACGVNRGERFGDLDRDGGHGSEIRPVLSKHDVESAAVDVLHHDVGAVVLLDDVEHVRDVGRDHARRAARFVHQLSSRDRIRA